MTVPLTHVTLPLLPALASVPIDQLDLALRSGRPDRLVPLVASRLRSWMPIPYDLTEWVGQACCVALGPGSIVQTTASKPIRLLYGRRDQLDQVDRLLDLYVALGPEPFASICRARGQAAVGPSTP